MGIQIYQLRCSTCFSVPEAREPRQSAVVDNRLGVGLEACIDKSVLQISCGIDEFGYRISQIMLVLCFPSPIPIEFVWILDPSVQPEDGMDASAAGVQNRDNLVSEGSQGNQLVFNRSFVGFSQDILADCHRLLSPDLACQGIHWDLDVVSQVVQVQKRLQAGKVFP